jgi:hypothetical protein
MTGFSRLRRAGFRLHRDERGQAALEFLLMIPFLVLFLALLIDLGVMMYAQVSTANAVREGARYASVNCGTLDCSEAVVRTRAHERSSGFLDDSDTDISVGWTGNVRGDSVVVRAHKEHEYIFFPFSIDLQSCSEMRLEQSESSVSGGADPC